ncbi:MAG: DUF1552 domain-containing protein [Gemmatimonadetes bacterium]|nr:DUF1552 domain-containing protein [Gemmatimonadota bacterium]
MFVSGKHVSRRAMLRGMGATVALPFLDAMIPAGPQAGRKRQELDKTRLVCIEEVHGVAGCNEWGADQGLFAPAMVGRDFELDALNVLDPLRKWQDSMTIVSNTDTRMAEAFNTDEIGGDHFRSTAVFLSQAHPKQTQGSDVYCGVSLDQLFAQRFGQDTALPSLQLCIERLDQAGGCWYNYHCAYTDSISWASPTEPLPMIQDPRAAFDLLFGSGGSNAERAIRRRTNRSILDWVVGEVGVLKKELGYEDRQRIDRYLQNIREVERRIEKIENFSASGEVRELPEAPPGVPDSFSEHMELMFDLQVLAMETDMTRVISFKTGRDASSRIFPESGTTTAFHSASHHGGKEESVLDFNLICQYRMGMMGYFLDRLENTMDGDGSLLEKSVILWGSPMGDANLHNHRRCPLVLFGKGNGALEGNLHLKAPDGTPMANAFLSLLRELGFDDMGAFGDSTGELPLSYATPVATDGRS